MINRLFSNEFNRNVLTLITGTTIAQSIPILISPLLSRMYSPEDFGVLALYMSIFSVLSVIVTGRLELTIMLPESDKEAILLVLLTALISCIMSLVFFLIFIIFNNQLIEFFGTKSLSIWFYFIPFSLLLYGLNQSFYYWSNRNKGYRNLSISRITQSISNVITSVIVVLFFKGPSGLILGQIIGQGFGAISLGRSFVSSLSKTKININFLLSKLSFYKNFPLQILPSHLIGVVSQQIPIFAIGKMYSNTELGLFMMANRLITLPSTIVANAIGDVFRQEATTRYHQNGKFDDLLVKTVKKSLAIAVIPYCVMYFFSPIIFEIVLGEEWRAAGEYASILLVSSFFSFIFAPVDKAAIIVNATKYILAWQISLLLNNLLLLLVTVYLQLSITTYLYGYVTIKIVHYVVDFIIELRFSKGAKLIEQME